MSFHYQSTKDDSYADIYLEVYESPYFNANDAIEERLTGYEAATNFELLQPIECGKYTLNKLPACSFGATWPNEGEPADTSLIILSVGQDGTGYEVTFSATNDLYNRFLPVAEYW